MCRIEDADGDGQWLTEPHEIVARKEHRCEDCGRVIAKGETYTTGAWISCEFDGLIGLKMCAHCKLAGRWLRVVCGGHLWPGVMEELREHWDEEYDLRSHGLGRLVTVGERRWQYRGRLASFDEIKRWTEMALSRVPASARH